EIGRPIVPGALGRNRDITIVITWNQKDALGRAERFELTSRLTKLALEGYVGEITAHQNAVDRL
ncbi:MAG: hypothetical protein V3T64_05215, partial [Myxococcota bacterium]